MSERAYQTPPPSPPLGVIPGTDLRVALVPTAGECGRGEIPIDQSPTVLGRADGDRVVAEPTMSARHVRLHVEEGKLYVTDLDSTNGTFLNGNRIRSAEAIDGDKIRCGRAIFEVKLRKVAPPPAPVDSTQPMADGIDETSIHQTRKLTPLPQPEAVALPGKTVYLAVFDRGVKKIYRLEKRSTLLGSLEGDILFTDESVSARHLQIEIQGGKVMAKDLMSSNGTLKEGLPISIAEVRDGDLLRCGNSQVRVVIRGKDDPPPV